MNNDDEKNKFSFFTHNFRLSEKKKHKLRNKNKKNDKTKQLLNKDLLVHTTENLTFSMRILFCLICFLFSMRSRQLFSVHNNFLTCRQKQTHYVRFVLSKFVMHGTTDKIRLNFRNRNNFFFLFCCWIESNNCLHTRCMRIRKQKEKSSFFYFSVEIFSSSLSSLIFRLLLRNILVPVIR